MFSRIFEATIQRGTASDRTVLDGLVHHTAMGSKAQLVYVYSLGPDEPSIPYPNRPGKVVYIGETQRETGAGRRFRGHISSSLTSGLSTNINHTLSAYYHSGRQLHLQVFSVTNGRTTKAVERIMLRTHLHNFGAYPLGQGSTGRDNTPVEVSRLYTEEPHLHEQCAKVIGCAL